MAHWHASSSQGDAASRTYSRHFEACGVESLLLPDEDRHVEQELLRQTTAGKTSQPGSWKLNHHKAYSNIRLNVGTPSPHKATTSSSWLTNLTGCQRSTLISQQRKNSSSSCTALGQGAALGQERLRNQCRTLLLDVDQSLEITFKITTINNGSSEAITIAHCMLHGQTLWVHAPHGEERLLLGREALVLQAPPVALVEEQIDQVSDTFQHDIAGNAMSFLVLLAVVQSGFASLNWRQQSVSDEDLGAISLPDADDAVVLLRMMARG